MGLFDGLKQDLVNDVFNEELQKEIVDALNANIDIPFLSEKTEEKMMNALYDTVEGIIKKKILEKV
jgi:hypothetical protein|tara:strand:+ start:1795 stop:1992 length:198 start_codon:yes stop_codon:yes gene_type:complete